MTTIAFDYSTFDSFVDGRAVATKHTGKVELSKRDDVDLNGVEAEICRRIRPTLPGLVRKTSSYTIDEFGKVVDFVLVDGLPDEECDVPIIAKG